MSARCQFCDEELRPNSMFCANCGQLVASVPPPFGAHVAGASPAPTTAAPAPASEKKKRRIGRVPLPGTFGAPAPDEAAPADPPAPPSRSTPTPAAAPAVPSPAPTPSPAPRPAPTPPGPSSVHVKLSTGSTIAIIAPAIVGRNPGVVATDARIAGVQIDDPSRSVSRAHIRIEPADGTLAVVDLGSANGTEVERGDSTTPLVTNRAFPLAVGDRVWMGADYYFDVIGL
ncbi:FHA domain-containing protein [Labedella populi]|uniref:FHA domain-containing protein n=1 Tax=Labedella populi TaxID=2498850 RepID=A0A444QFH6_9MICO|nr:FHA domain-containing protein [Labedella populi]RWZ68323.1 FHA domain-containing protein [Labedella populi]